VALTLLVTGAAAGCSGGGAQTGAMMPAANGIGGNTGSANATVRIFVPASPSNGFAHTPVPLPPGASNLPVMGGVPQLPIAASPGAAPTASPPPGGQVLAINIGGPAAINQTVAVGPNASGCTPAAGGTSCQLSLALPAGTYAGTIGAPNAAAATAIAFTVSPSGQNVFALTTGGVPTQIAIVSASSLGAQNQGGIDLYGAGRHAIVVEALDANQNVIVGGPPANFSLIMAGGALPLTITQSTAGAPNLFYVTPSGTASTASAFLRATASYLGPSNPCLASSAVCAGNIRIDDRQIIGVANSAANDVTVYAGGQSAPLVTVGSGVTDPQALVFDALGNLFVADEPGSVTEYAPPYATAPTTIVSGVNHPQALAVDARGDLFVANGSGSNTVTLYAPPYNGLSETTISAGVDDPVDLSLDGNANLYVVNEANNTVTIYAPPYGNVPIVISKGLNAPNSLALDARGNLFVANLNSTPNSVAEYSPPFSKESAPVATITNGVNEQGTIGLGGSANLFVPNQGANTVTEYVAPYVNAPTTISGGQSQPVALAIDAPGNLYVANLGNNTITQYAPPYASGSWTTISNGISMPVAIALSPVSGAGLSLVP